MTWRRVVLVAAVLAAACSREAPGDRPGGADPGECFAKMKDAMARSDWGSLWDQNAPETRGLLLASSIGPWAQIRRGTQASPVLMKPEPESVRLVEDVLKEHGVSLDALARGLDTGPEAFLEGTAGVADKRGLFVAMMFQTVRAPEVGMPLMVRLEDLRIDGDRATGVGILSYKGTEAGRKALTFEKIGDRWFRAFGK